MKSRERFDKIDKKNLENDETNIAMLRNTITHIYFKYKDVKKIHHYEKENLVSLYERYEQLHGNHYVKMIVEEMEDWEEII
jgi:iron-sulfur cluster repair protein YtfE (RIC family)